MPNSIPSAILSALELEEFRFAEVYELYLAAGTLRYSRHALTWGGNSYTAMAMKRSPIRERLRKVATETEITFSNVTGALLGQIEPDDLLTDRRIVVRLLIWDTSTGDWSTDSHILFGGLMQRPKQIDENEFQIPCVGLLQARLAACPGRVLSSWCQVRGFADGVDCNYSSTTTASNSGSSSTALVVADASDLEEGEEITIGAGAAVAIDTIAGSNVTLAEARTWSASDAVAYVSCDRSWRQCQLRNREHEFQGFVGKDLATRDPVVEIDDGDLIYQTIPGPGDALDDPKAVVPLVYGRRYVAPRAIDSATVDGIDTLPSDFNVWWHVLSEGEVVGLDAFYYLDGEAIEAGNQWSGGADDVLDTDGHHWKVGAIGLAGSNAESVYNADPTAVAQKAEPFALIGLASAYSRTAVAIFFERFDVGTRPPLDPDWGFDLRGTKIWSYDSGGSQDTQTNHANPVWQVVDLLLNTRYGQGRIISSSLVDLVTSYSGASICDGQLEPLSVIQTVGNAGGPTSTDEIIVDDATEYRRGDPVYLNDVDQSTTIARILSANRVKLASAISVTNGDEFSTRVSRFESHPVFDRRESFVSAVEAILATCRGYLTYDQGKIQVRVEGTIGSSVGHWKDQGGATGYKLRDFKLAHNQRDRDVNQVNVEYSLETFAEFEKRDIGSASLWTDVQSRGVNPRDLRRRPIVRRDQANRLAQWELDRRRLSGGSFLATPAALQLIPGDRITVTAAAGQWTGKECRVTELAKRDDLLVEVSVELYDASIYADVGYPYPGGVVTPNLPSITLSVASPDGRRVALSWTLSHSSGSGAQVRRFRVYRSTTTPVPRSRAYQVAELRGVLSYEYPVREDEVDTLLYFAVVAVGSSSSAPVSSNEVSTTPRGITTAIVDPTLLQAAQGSNLVYDGEFSDPANWTTSGGSTGDVDPSSSATHADADTGFSSPANAYDNNTGTESQGTSTYDSGTQTESIAGTVWSGFGTGTKNGIVKVQARRALTASGGDPIEGVVRLYYSTDGGTSYTIFGVVQDTSLETIKSPDLFGVDMTQLRVWVDVRAIDDNGATDRTLDCYVAEIDFVEYTTTPRSLVVGGVAGIIGNGSAYGRLYRRFPGQSPVESSAVLFSASTKQWARIRARRYDPATAPTAALEVELFDSSTGTSWAILTVAAGDIGASWQEYAARFTPGSDVSGKLFVRIGTTSTAGILVDKLQIVSGELLVPFGVSPEEVSAGSYPDVVDGVGQAFDPGAWTVGPTNYKTSPVS